MRRVPLLGQEGSDSLERRAASRPQDLRVARLDRFRPLRGFAEDEHLFPDVWRGCFFLNASAVRQNERAIHQEGEKLLISGRWKEANVPRTFKGFLQPGSAQTF